MSERFLAKIVASPMLATTLIMLIIIISIDILGAEARPSPLTKKPPFNGSMFGKRSVLPAMAPPPLPQPSFDGGANSNAAGALAAPNESIGSYYYSTPYNILATKLLKQLQLQEQQDLAILRAALSRCLDQQQQATPVSAETIEVCEGLYALANRRDRFS